MTNNQSLYHKVKPCLDQDLKIVLSDQESLLLNRRDFHVNQISPVQATLSSLGVNVSYPFRVLLSFLDAFAIGLNEKDFNVIATDPSLAVACYHVWLRSGGRPGRGKIYAPKGMPTFPEKQGIVGDLINDFMSAVDNAPNARPSKERLNDFTFVIGNTKTSAQTLFAADQFAPVKRGLLLLKDFSRVDAFDERDYLESRKIFVSVTFEGHAFALKL